MDSDIIYENKEEKDKSEVNSSDKCNVEVENIIENSLENNSVKEISAIPSVLNFTQTKADSEFEKEDTFDKSNSSTAFIRTILTSIDCPKNSVEVFKKLKSESVNTGLSQENVTEEIFIDNIEEEQKLPVDNTRKATGDSVKVESEDIYVAESYSSKENKHTFNPVIRKIIHLPEGYTDSSHSSSSELQISTVPFESSCSSQENNFNSSRINFENALPPTPVWKEFNEFTTPEVPVPSKSTIQELSLQPEVPAPPNIPVITIDENTEPGVGDVSTNSVPAGSNETVTPTTINQVFPPLAALNEEEPNTTLSECKTKLEESNAEILSTPQPALVVPPTPRKRGRPRKQVLPNPSPLVESWGPNAQEFVAINTPKDPKRSTRSERRAKKKKFNEENEKQDGDDSTPKRRYAAKTTVKKKKRRTTYVPKKRGPQAKKKHSEMENIQNFEEETRMSASEGQGGFSSRSGVIGEESQSSFVTAEGQTKSNINKKGRMEVMTDGCKPVTVQQIVEYHWPPPSSLPHGEKPEGLMIQEQITEYLGVKSFKRKYPSIKRRPVDMEERNYLQENGFVSENMCDMGLTAVFSADIIEIMYNDFPQKFEEYRKYTREKKAKEQRALREKQAAERADMDPLKEAVESAQTWNTEFNKTRRFRLLHSSPELREFTDGSPCAPFERLVISHAPDNAALGVEVYWSMGFFSYECEVSANNKGISKRKIDPSKFWMFVVRT